MNNDTINKLKNFINKYKVFIIGIIFFILAFLVFYFYSLSLIIKQEAEWLRQELKALQALQQIDIPADELFRPGEIGEIETDPEMPLPANELPAMVFNTSGMIQEVLDNRVIVLGDGANFADGQPRQLTLLFTIETNVFLADRTQYVGLRGLNYLRPGMQILINSVENMRGRTEFRVSNINVL